MALRAGFGRLGMWNGPSFGVPGGWTSFLDELSAANNRWTTFEAKMRGTIDAQVLPWASTVETGIKIAETIDFSSPAGFMNTLVGLAALAGPYGAMASSVISTIQKIKDFFLGAAPAFAIQLQSQHYAQLDDWLARNILRQTGGDVEDRIGFMYGKGWVPIYSNSSGGLCENSGAGTLGSWRVDGEQPSTAEQNMALFSLVAGPRSVPIRRCAEISPRAMSDWLDSEEGRRSITASERLSSVLSRGGFTKGTFAAVGQNEARSFQSEGLVFVNALRLDLDPGYRQYNVWGDVIMVNVTRLPDALLFPIADYIGFRMQAEEKGVYNSETEGRIKRAAFGTDGQMFQEWNLLRLIYDALQRAPLPIAALKEASARQPMRVRPIGAKRGIVGQPKSSGPGTGTVVVGGLGLAALIYALLA